jgi:hypothetical protein
MLEDLQTVTDQLSKGTFAQFTLLSAPQRHTETDPRSFHDLDYLDSDNILLPRLNSGQTGLLRLSPIWQGVRRFLSLSNLPA